MFDFRNLAELNFSRQLNYRQSLSLCVIKLYYIIFYDRIVINISATLLYDNV